jgi:hypothetical protein
MQIYCKMLARGRDVDKQERHGRNPKKPIAYNLEFGVMNER